MNAHHTAPTIYTASELRSDAVVHIIGLIFALIGVPVLITLAALWIGDTLTIAAATIYGLTLLTMLGCSAIYNMVHHPARKDLLRRFDQSAIYLKIAGTYTPLAVLTGSHMSYFLTGVWGAALAGVTMIIFSPGKVRWPSLALYLGLGWAGLVWGQQLFGGLTPTGFWLIFFAGCTYTGGVVFFLWESLPHHNTIWHAFVLTATAALYCAIVIELSHTSRMLIATAIP